MADLLCQRCGEPWDLYYVNHEMTDQERRDFHTGKACPSCCKTPDEELNLSERQKDAITAQAAMRSVLGDDLDGLAAEMEDFGFT